jgi:hypothetical protein
MKYKVLVDRLSTDHLSLLDAERYAKHLSEKISDWPFKVLKARSETYGWDVVCSYQNGERFPND